MYGSPPCRLQHSRNTEGLPPCGCVTPAPRYSSSYSGLAARDVQEYHGVVADDDGGAANCVLLFSVTVGITAELWTTPTSGSSTRPGAGRPNRSLPRSPPRQVSSGWSSSLPHGTLADRLRRGPVPAPPGPRHRRPAGPTRSRPCTRRGNLHGDVKPSNVGFASDGSPKLLDFGLAREANDATGMGGNLALTCRLRCCRGGRPTRRDDVWSLCVMVYEMVRGSNCLRGAAPTRCGTAFGANVSPAALPPRAPAQRRPRSPSRHRC